MAKVHVANASPQIHEFHYRIPEILKRRTLTILPFRQVVLPDDMNVEQISAVVAQHEQYGFVSADDVKNGKARKAHTRLCYSIDKPISSMVIDALYRNNYTILDAQGKEIRKTMAVMANSAVQNTLEAERRNGLDANVAGFNITLQEEDQIGKSGEELSSGPLAEGYIVADENSMEHPPVRPRDRKGSSRARIQ